MTRLAMDLLLSIKMIFILFSIGDGNKFVYACKVVINNPKLGRFEEIWSTEL